MLETLAAVGLGIARELIVPLFDALRTGNVTRARQEAEVVAMAVAAKLAIKRARGLGAKL